MMITLTCSRLRSAADWRPVLSLLTAQTSHISSCVLWPYTNLLLTLTLNTMSSEGYSWVEFYACQDVQRTELNWTEISAFSSVALRGLHEASELAIQFNSVHFSSARFVRCLRAVTVDAVRSLIRNIIVILPVLGLTWVFGVVAINSHLVAFQFIFAVCNSLQVRVVSRHGHGLGWPNYYYYYYCWVEFGQIWIIAKQHW